MNSSLNKNHNPSPPKIGQICISKIAPRTYRVVAEIINENDKVGLYKFRVRTLAIDNKDSVVGASPLLSRYSNIISLPPKKKYIYVNILLAHKEVHTVRIIYPPLKWIDYSLIYVPKAVISDDQLVERNGKFKLLFNITNMSHQKKAFQINIGFYNSNGILIGGITTYTKWRLKPNWTKLIEINIPLVLPPNSTYVIQPYTSF